MKYIPQTPADEKAMLAVVGVDTVEDLFADIPARFRFPEVHLPPGVSQLEMERRLAALADANISLRDLTCLLGAGAYRHYVPPVVDAILQRGEFLTAYTPYQPELAQGTLTAAFEFQSMVAALTGMEVANASLYDGASALAEATLMAARATRRDGVVLAASLSPAARETVATYAQGLALPIAEVPWGADGRAHADLVRKAVGASTACLAVGYPNFFGVMEDLEVMADIAHGAGALLAVYANPIALGLYAAPGDLGADIVVGEGQPLGVPLMFGGPSLGIMATRRRLMRTMPGRVVGATTDVDGRRAFVMTLRAREQDIRRQRATSNICTNQNLVALAATVYMAAMGEEGLKEVALQCYHKAHYTRDRLAALAGYEAVFDGPHFHEFALRLPKPVAEVADELLAEGFAGPYDLGPHFEDLAGCALFCITEMVPREEIDRLVGVLAAVGGAA